MSNLHTKPNTQNTINEKDFRFLCVNENCLEIQKNENNIFSEETLKSIGELGNVLRDIHTRMVNSGYVIKDGIIVKNENE